MSHDVYVSCHTCGNALNYGHESLPAGCGGLFEELGVPVLDWNGKVGVDVLPKLASALKELEDPMTFGVVQAAHRRHDDTWDRAEFAVGFLTAMRDGICRDPWAVIHVC